MAAARAAQKVKHACTIDENELVALRPTLLRGYASICNQERSASSKLAACILLVRRACMQVSQPKTHIWFLRQHLSAFDSGFGLNGHCCCICCRGPILCHVLQLGPLCLASHDAVHLPLSMISYFNVLVRTYMCVLKRSVCKAVCKPSGLLAGRILGTVILGRSNRLVMQ